jgi:hypothetical protein
VIWELRTTSEMHGKRLLQDPSVECNPEERAVVTAFKDRLNNLWVTVTRENFQAMAIDVRNKIRKLKGSWMTWVQHY